MNFKDKSNQQILKIKSKDDEDFLVDNEEEMDIKEELEIKQDSRKEYLGKFQYKVVYYSISIIM